jgi:hypothetical protein
LRKFEASKPSLPAQFYQVPKSILGGVGTSEMQNKYIQKTKDVDSNDVQLAEWFL